MRFIFRADASREIGSGHVMRTSVLAEEAISRGYECVFIGEIMDLDWVKTRVIGLGFSQILTSDESFTPDVESDVLVLDSYTLPISDSFIAKIKWKMVLSICDAITPKYDVDIELHPGIENLNVTQSRPKVISGADYILIRKGIEKSNRSSNSENLPRVLIVGGGSDPFGFVREISSAIYSLNLGLEVHQFSDEISPDRPESGFVTHRIGPELDSIAGDFDLVFTTASTSSLEFIAREIPVGVACAVNNQEDYYEQLQQLGLAAPIGAFNSNGKWDLNMHSIKELIQSKEKRQSLNEAMCGLIDLNGAARVVDALISFASSSES
jgi:spore coat polysaccharide biosynthesis predicted glycosyltransferase SpsG